MFLFKARISYTFQRMMTQSGAIWRVDSHPWIFYLGRKIRVDFFRHTVDVRNPAPVEVGSLPHDLQGFYIPGGAGFRPSTVHPRKLSFQDFLRLYCDVQNESRCLILFMEEIPENHLGCIKPCISINCIFYHINYCGAGFLQSEVLPRKEITVLWTFQLFVRCCPSRGWCQL